jgi:dTMP kinase
MTMFISLEGIEGSGKSTQVPYIEDLLRQHGYEVVVTREPGGTVIGEKIRSILLDPRSRDIHPITELLLYFADRSQHVQERILPSLDVGRVVVCDRYVDATLAYQGVARRLGVDLIRELHRLLLDDLKPDLTLLFDLPPSTGLSRAWRQLEGGERVVGESRFEAEALAFHETVRRGYLSLAATDTVRYRVIDAGAAITEVREQIRQIIVTDVLNHPL